MHSSGNHGHRRNPWVHAMRVRFFWLLVLLVGFILIVPSLPTSSKGQWEIVLMGMINISAAIFLSQGPTRIWTMVILALTLIGVAAIYIFSGDPVYLLKICLIVVLFALIYTASCVLSFVLDEGEVGTEHIYGAICAYILIAMAFATLYFLLELKHPGSFSGIHTTGAAERPWWQFFYFSFTTLATVGYGDIVPVTMRARSFVIIEQLVAIFYVAILISRLTGMYTSSSKPR